MWRGDTQDRRQPRSSPGWHALSVSIWLCLLVAACGGGADVAPELTDTHVSQSRVATTTDDVEETPTGSVTRSSADLDLVRDETNQLIGLRFMGLDVPKGALVTDAYIRFTTQEATSEKTSLTIRGVAVDDAATFISARFNVSSQTTTNASVAWSPPPWNAEGASGPGQRTADLSPIVQEIIDRPGWSRGGALAFIVTGTGRRVAESFDGSPENAPRLEVTFTFDENVDITTFAARPVEARVGQVVTFAWSVTGVAEETVSCQLDADGDGIPDYDVPDCLATKTQTHTYPVAGHYTASLTATDGSGAATTATAEVAVTTPDSVTVAAAGDIACDPASKYFNGGLGSEGRCRMKATSDLLLAMKPDAVLTLGDNQYDDATLKKFMASYDPTWGRLKAITHPAPGTHEYDDGQNGAGYFAFFGAAAGDPAKGYYSFDLGEWHGVVLNTSCSSVGGCDSGSPQERWLRADLAANPKRCTLAVLHEPRFSSGKHGSITQVTDLWRALHGAGVELVLSGNDHTYERFTPQTPDGVLDLKRGIRQFVVGTGGKELYSFGAVQPGSEARIANVYGVLKLNLHPESYDWAFMPEAGQTASDKGVDRCH